MKASTAIVALCLGCILVPAGAQTATPPATPTQPAQQVDRIDVDEFIGPFKPTPQSAAEDRKEAYAAQAWFSRVCRETTRGAAQRQCMQQVRRDLEAELAKANSRR